MLRTAGVSPGAPVSTDGGKFPPGAVGGRRPPVIWFHGHMVSLRLWPMRVAPGLPALPRNEKLSVLEMSKRRLNHCHLAHKRSTFACSKKNNGSLAAVGILEIDPPKLTWAGPSGLPSRFRNGS